MSDPVKRYDSMGFEGEFGIWVRAVDYYALAKSLSEERDRVTTLRESMRLDAETIAAKDRRIAALERDLTAAHEAQSGMARDIQVLSAELAEANACERDNFRRAEDNLWMLEESRSYAVPFTAAASYARAVLGDWMQGVEPRSDMVVKAFRLLDAALAKNPNPSGHFVTEASGLSSPEASGPVGLGPITVTTNEAGECVAVTRTDDEGRILSVIWERASPEIVTRKEAP